MRGLAVLALLAAGPTWSEEYDWLANLSVLQLPAAELARRGIVSIDVGEIGLPTGRIVAVDPYTAWGLVPFARRVPPGDYAVRLWFDADYQTRPALAELTIHNCTPVLWQNAVPEGESLADLEPGNAFGFGVDAGAGSFAPPEFFEAFGDVVDGDFLSDAYGDFAGGELFDRAFPDDSGVPQDFVITHEGQRMAVFSSGWGDGFYFSYWGFDEAGCPCALVTDFGVLDRGYPFESPLFSPQHGAREAPADDDWGDDGACPVT